MWHHKTGFALCFCWVVQVVLVPLGVVLAIIEIVASHDY